MSTRENIRLITRAPFLASLFSRGEWFETRFVGNPEDRFSRVVASYISVACSTALEQILQVQQIIIFKKNNEEAVHQIFCYALHRLICKSFVTTTHRARERRGL